ncbi:AAA family ATPase [Bradyrhizobium sp. AZCC 1708]|uniref:AAA family ATPase n=1 Tax=Bradyrhizobium sp. AZCC 1708 TaxID=3117015 RepID=UPI002FEF14ED
MYIPSKPGEKPAPKWKDPICLTEFAKLKLPPRKMLLHPILPEKGLAMLFAGRGIGKTHVALGIAHAVSCGGTFLRWEAQKPRSVLYVDGEMPQQALQERIKALQAGSIRGPDAGAFKFLCMDAQELGQTINLADAKHQRKLNGFLNDVSFLVLDNMSTLMNGGPENDAESWDSMQAWLLQLRRKGVTVLIVHHASRGGNARGTSKREDVLDTVIQLKHPSDYSPADGARFEVHLTKARGIFGQDAEPFEAKLVMDPEGKAVWTCTDLGEDDNEEMEQILTLAKAGNSVREIASQIDKPKTVVHRILQKAKQAQAAEAGARPN